MHVPDQQGAPRQHLNWKLCKGCGSILIDSFNPDTIDGLMCRHQISIDPQARLYDCDFNQALNMKTRGLEATYLWEVTADDLAERVIATDDHCYGCTAGSACW